MLIASTFALLLAIIAGGAWYILQQESESAQAAETAKASKLPVFSALESFVVNLQPERGAEQYLQVAMTLQLADSLQFDQIKLYTPVVRSRLLALLSSKRPSELTSMEGKNALAEEIMVILNEPLTPTSPSLGITNVFFTAFVIQ